MRPVYCLLGLPFDALTLDAARERIVAGVGSGQHGILSTPNVNWVATAHRLPEFRDTILPSACCTLDGMPLLWLARLLGVPMSERVSGADLFTHLQGAEREIRVFFFGGDGDVGLRACQRLAEARGRLRPVGALNPGRGSLDSMSTPEILATINRARPDIVVVSLGALKGQRWIQRNRAQLEAAWLTHLGAVVNFVAGDVKRAPVRFSRLGLEWLWRIVQEPALWRRYAGDAGMFGSLLATRVLPLVLRRFLRRRPAGPRVPPSLERVDSAGSLLVALSGDWQEYPHDAATTAVWQRFGELAAASAVTIEIGAVTDLDAALIGQLLVLRGRLQDSGAVMRVAGATRHLRRLFYLHAAEFLIED